MQQSVEYQIFIGLNDAQVYEEVVNEKELVEIVSNYFERKEIDFSMFKATHCVSILLEKQRWI